MRNRAAASLAAAACSPPAPSGPRYEEPGHADARRTSTRRPPRRPREPAGSKLWAGFGSTELDALITRALAANTTIAQAAARLAETRALSGLSVYSWFPTVTAVGRPRRRRSSAPSDPLAPGGIRTDTYRAGFDAQLGDRPVRLAAQRVPRHRPAHRGGRGRARRRAALDRRRDRAGLVRDDRRARAPRAAARSSSRTWRTTSGSSTRASMPAARTALDLAQAEAQTARRRRLACRSPRPTSCARSSGSRC